MTKGIRALQLGRGPGLLSAFPVWSCSSSLTERKIVAKLQRSVSSLLLTRDISSASHLPPEARAHCKSHLGPSEHHRWTKMGLLIYSKSHNQNVQRELDKNSGPGYSLSQGFVLYCSEICHLSPCPCFLNEMLLRLFMKWVILVQEGGSGLYGSLELILILTFSLATFRQRTCQYLGL